MTGLDDGDYVKVQVTKENPFYDETQSLEIRKSGLLLDTAHDSYRFL